MRYRVEVAKSAPLHNSKGVSDMFTLILTLIVSKPSCSGPNCIGYSTIATVPGFESFGLCQQAGNNWVQTVVTVKQSQSAKYVCVQLK
ncbi:MAG: hypothetical protein ACRD3Q_05100 [Terriglobales bacterium]